MKETLNTLPEHLKQCSHQLWKFAESMNSLCTEFVNEAPPCPYVRLNIFTSYAFSNCWVDKLSVSRYMYVTVDTQG